MVDGDIFREVDEEMRRERIKKLWELYGRYVIAGAVAIIAIVAGFEGWKYWTRSQAESGGARYEQAAALLADGKTAEAEAAFGEIASTGRGGYVALAQLRLAGAKLAAGDRSGALAEYDRMIADTGLDPVLRNYAGVRAASIAVDDASWTDMQNRLKDVTTPESPWRITGFELLGLSAWKHGMTEEADKHFNRLLADPESPANVRRRAEMMLALILAKDARQVRDAGAAPAGESAGSTGSAGGSTGGAGTSGESN